MEHLEDLVESILTTTPNQLPPVIHTGGCYTLDVSYLGTTLHCTAISLGEVLYRYLDFVTKANYRNTRRINVLTDAPVPPGSPITTISTKTQV